MLDEIEVIIQMLEQEIENPQSVPTPVSKQIHHNTIRSSSLG